MTASIEKLEELLQIQENELGHNDPALSTLLDDLSYACHCRGIFDRAEECYVRSLALRESVQGPHDQSLLPGLQRLGILYRIQNKFEEAEPYYLRALKITERQVGLEHPQVAIRLNYLAGLYFAWEKFDDAERLVKNSVYIYEKFWGPNHQVLAPAYMGLAIINSRQGKYDAALSYFRQSCALTKNFHADDAPTSFQDISHSLMLLAQGHFRKQEYGEAEVLLRHSMLIEARELWPDHPIVADSLTMLADLYRAQKLYREAEFCIAKLSKSGKTRLVLSILMSPCHCIVWVICSLLSSAKRRLATYWFNRFRFARVMLAKI